MNSRERFIKAFDFANPDKLPVVYHPSTAGLYVHGQKLLDLFKAFPPDNPCGFDRLPEPPPGTVDVSGQYHEFRKDDLGTTWEYRIFGIAGHPHTYAINNWDDPVALPSVPQPGSEEFRKAAEWVAGQKKDYLTFGGWGNIFERLHALRPFEEVLMDLALETPALMRFIERYADWLRRHLEYQIAIGVEVMGGGDDWGTQDSLIVSPTTFRRVFKPILKELMTRSHAAGRRVMYHSCGAVYPLYGELVECGIDGLWHQIALYDAEKFARECAANRTLLYLHLDRQRLIPLGTPHEIRETVKRYADLHKALGGGAAFYVEIENDAPFANVEALITAVHAYR